MASEALKKLELLDKILSKKSPAEVESFWNRVRLESIQAKQQSASAKRIAPVSTERTIPTKAVNKPNIPGIVRPRN